MSSDLGHIDPVRRERDRGLRIGHMMPMVSTRAQKQKLQALRERPERRCQQCNCKLAMDNQSDIDLCWPCEHGKRP